MNPIQLAAEGGDVYLDTSAPDWVRCTLVCDHREIFLGAESPQYLYERLKRALLEGGHALDGEVDGHVIFRVLSLFEGHYVLYMAQEGDERFLFWQDAGRSGSGLQRMHLTSAQRLEWAARLEQLNQGA